MKTKILICGATGFIGRNLTEQLSKKPELEVHAVRFQRSAYDCGNNVIWHQADLRRHDDADRVVKEMDIIIQASEPNISIRDCNNHPEACVTDSTIMNAYLFHAAQTHKVKHLVYLSCAGVYPSSDKPLKESDFDANIKLKGKAAGASYSKMYFERLCEYYATTSSTKYTAIRHASVYGPHDKFDPNNKHIVGSTIAKTMTADDKIIMHGTGEESYDLLYIDDLIRLIMAAIEKQPGQFGLYNCGTGKATTALALANQIAQASGKDLSVEHDLSEPTIASSQSLDCSLAKQDLDWLAEVDLDTGLRKTMSWCRENIRFRTPEPA